VIPGLICKLFCACIPAWSLCACSVGWFLSLSIFLQEECKLLIDATIDGNMDVVTGLSNDGVDMDAIIGKVCRCYCL